MFRLTREVRFALTGEPPDGHGNGHGGVPAAAAVVPWVALRITLAGILDPHSNYLRNIKDIDSVTRARAIPLLNHLATGTLSRGRLGEIPLRLFETLKDSWAAATLDSVELWITPYCAIVARSKELPMTRLSQKFEFSAAHRLHNPALSDRDNVQAYGKCNNPHGHGHNYELQVTVAGTPDASGTVIAVGELERVVNEAVIQKLDHKHLNVEVPEFASLIPSVENIAMVIYRLLKPMLGLKLAGVTVWETPKTWCEYSE